MGKTIYPWQQDAWRSLQQLRARLPHALLFHGAAGTGKADFIECFAQSLLCEDVRADGHACGACASCGWFVQHNHPDYRRVRPEALEQWVHPHLQPDLTLLFDVPLAVARARLDATRTLDKFEQEQADFFGACRSEYLRRATQFPERFRVIDSTRSIAAIQRDLAGLLDVLLEFVS